MKKAAFLDRDGVINEKAPEGAYITRWEDVRFLPGIAEAIAQLNRAGFQVIIVSNQRCVAKGLITTGELETLHRRIVEWLGARGAVVNAVYYCPHEKTQPSCDCRKPAPGMLLQAAKDHQIDPPQSWMIGDSESDLKAGHAAGCKTVRIRMSDTTNPTNADLAVSIIGDAILTILGTKHVDINR